MWQAKSPHEYSSQHKLELGPTILQGFRSRCCRSNAASMWHKLIIAAKSTSDNQSESIQAQQCYFDQQRTSAQLLTTIQTCSSLTSESLCQSVPLIPNSTAAHPVGSNSTLSCRALLPCGSTPPWWKGLTTSQFSFARRRWDSTTSSLVREYLVSRIQSARA